jgi:putative addiction module CopG family antidote
MEVILTPRQEKFIKNAVADGRYLDESEVIRDALRLMENHLYDDDTPEMEALVVAGWESGGFETWGPDMKQRLLASATGFPASRLCNR